MSRKALRNLIVSIALISAVMAAAALRLHLNGLPEVQGMDAPPDRFSAVRALGHAKIIAATVHPCGSDENGKAGDYIATTLTRLGYDVTEQYAVGARTWFPNYYTAGPVRNIIVRIPGKKRAGTVLFMAHYDSIGTGPGGNDDAAAVGAMIEAMRAMKSRSPLDNDCIFLFTDGEETGLLGADAFFREHPWSREVDVVANFEARGSRGPSTLFETGSGSGSMVRSYIKAATHPTGNSLTNAVYAFLPNDTDFTVAVEKGYRGFNFAYVENVAAYHTMLDTPGNIDLRSLQHHGSNLLALAEAFRSGIPGSGVPDEAVYFPVIGGIMAIYPFTAANSLNAAALLLSAAAMFLLLWKKNISPRRLAAGFGVQAFLLVLVPSTVYLLWRLVLVCRGEYADMPMGDTYNSGWYAAAVIALALFSHLVPFAAGRRNPGALHLFGGALVWWWLFLALSAVFLPGMTWLFLWPLLFGMIHFSLSARCGGRPGLYLVPLCVPAVLLMTYFIHSLFVGLTVRMAPVAVFFTALSLPLLNPLWDEIMERSGKMLMVISVAAFAVSMAGWAATAFFDENHPRPNSVVYALDDDDDEAFWMSCDPAVDSWTAQFFPGADRGTEVRKSMPRFFPLLESCLMRPGGFLVGKAPLLRPAPPKIMLVSDKTGSRRDLRLKIMPGRPGDSAMLMIKAAGKGINSLTVNGVRFREVSPDSLKPGHKLLVEQVDLVNWMVLRYQAVPAGGFDLSLSMKSGERLEIVCAGITGGLPSLGAMGYRSREKWMMPSPDFLLQDSTVVSRHYSF